ncbi:MAG TPA: SAM-dependent methyltransferase [Candidatus Acidoferrales bacterium]|nr:SAM-dependent methyltransferase [Candidatus Acidoferrales bacterium]
MSIRFIMKASQSSRTAEYVAFFRALESAKPPSQRLFSDPLARSFVGFGLRCAVSLSRLPGVAAMVASYADRRAPGARTSAVARTCVIDQELREALKRGLSQVVILGAGFDSRAYRMPEVRSAAVFEVDHPATGSTKQAHLRRLLPKIPDNVRFVAINFQCEKLPEVLAASGFDAHRPAIFLWEGVTNYLTADAVDAVLRWVGSCPSHSEILMTYIHSGVIDGSAHFEGGERLLRQVSALGEPWTFGLDPAGIRDYLRERGLQLRHDAGAREYRRQCFGPSADRMNGYDFYRLAIAEVANEPQARVFAADKEERCPR